MNQSNVHDVLICGNTKTNDWVIKAELKLLEEADTLKELICAFEIALARDRLCIEISPL